MHPLLHTPPPVIARRLRDEAIQAMIPLHASQLWDHPLDRFAKPRETCGDGTQKGRSLRNGPLHEFHQWSPEGDPDAPA